MRLAHVWYHAYALPDSKLNPKKRKHATSAGGGVPTPGAAILDTGHRRRRVRQPAAASTGLSQQDGTRSCKNSKQIKHQPLSCKTLAAGSVHHVGCKLRSQSHLAARGPCKSSGVHNTHTHTHTHTHTQHSTHHHKKQKQQTHRPQSTRHTAYSSP